MPTGPQKSYCVDKLTVCLARASMAVLTFTVLVMVAGGSVFDLINPASGQPAVTSPPRADGIHYWLELGSFLATIGLFFGGIAALIVAMKHANHVRQTAEDTAKLSEATVRARTAVLYTNLLQRWGEEEMEMSRRLIRELADNYKQKRAARDTSLDACGILSESQYVKHVLIHFRETDIISLRKYTRIVEIFEYMGVLCRQDYVSRQDLFDFFGGFIKIYLDWLRPYFLTVREEVERLNAQRSGRGEPPLYEYPSAIFANSIWLSEEIDRFQPFAHAGRTATS